MSTPLINSSLESEVRRAVGNLPSHMQDVVLDYVLYGLAPGHFLTAVITNNLKEAVAHADSINQAALVDYVRFFYNDTPSSCWGSIEAFNEWLQAGTAQRERDVLETR